MKRLNNYIIFTISLIILGCEHRKSHNFISENELTLVVRNIIEYNDDSLDFESLFYSSEKYKCDQSVYLNRTLIEHFNPIKTLKISNESDTSYFCKYLTKGLNLHYKGNNTKGDDKYIYTSDLYLKGDTILFIIARPHFFGRCFFLHKKNLNVISSKVLLHF